jgi:uncharacterized membrane protein
MILILTIIHYLVAAFVDVFDKFLLEKRKIEPVQYTFYTMVTGTVILAMWPFVYERLNASVITLSLFSGAFLSLTFYCFYLSLQEGEISRVVPFVFGLVPLFDVVISWASGVNPLTVSEFSALCVLVPGAFLLAHHKGRWLPRHVLFKVVTALFFSIYYALWQYAGNMAEAFGGDKALTGALMWNRVGAAGLLIVLLAFPYVRKKVFSTKAILNKKSTSFLFIFKQLIGGANFIFFSWLLTKGKNPVINGLQGFRYAFLILIALFLTRKFKHVLAEETDKRTLFEKAAGIVLIFIGTLILFLA